MCVSKHLQIIREVLIEYPVVCKSLIRTYLMSFEIPAQHCKHLQKFREVLSEYPVGCKSLIRTYLMLFEILAQQSLYRTWQLFLLLSTAILDG